MGHKDWEHDHQEKLEEMYLEKYQGYVYDPPVLKKRCAGCGEIFYTQARSRLYCDLAACARLAINRRNKERRLAQRENTMCLCCGKLFTPKRTDAKYCSNACRQKGYRCRCAAEPGDLIA